MSQHTPDDGSHPDCTPVNEFLENLGRSFARPSPPAPGLQLPDSFVKRLAESCDGIFDKINIESLAHEVQYGMGLALGQYLMYEKLSNSSGTAELNRQINELLEAQARLQHELAAERRKNQALRERLKPWWQRLRLPLPGWAGGPPAKDS